MTRSEAIDYVYQRVPVADYPALTPELVRSLVDAGTRCTAHSTETAYSFGDRVVPAAPNGREYRCVVPGTSGATVPTWPSYTYARNGQLITDGTVTWRDEGPAYPTRFDMGQILREVWLAKAAVAAADVDVTDGTLKVSASQAWDRCIKMANRHSRVGAL